MATVAEGGWEAAVLVAWVRGAWGTEDWGMEGAAMVVEASERVGQAMAARASVEWAKVG